MQSIVKSRLLTANDTVSELCLSLECWKLKHKTGINQCSVNNKPDPKISPQSKSIVIQRKKKKRFIVFEPLPDCSVSSVYCLPLRTDFCNVVELLDSDLSKIGHPLSRSFKA